jgi:hypothetical protein
MPFCDTEAMHAHLAEIGAMVAPDATPSFCSTRRTGISLGRSSYPPTSRSCRCRRVRQS